jgi:amino acid transporter
MLGFFQAFVYAEIAGLHPTKTGGAAVYGATAWARYARPLAPLSIWSNWLAWTPVLAIGSGLAAGYLLSIVFDPKSAVMAWRWTLLDLGFVAKDLSVRIDATFVLGAAIMLIVFAIQHRGILRTAQFQTVLAVASLLPLLLICAIPLLQGSVRAENYLPFVPLAQVDGKAVPGQWDQAGVLVFMGGLFIAAWSAYAFETAVCYMSEFKNPGHDMPRAIIVSGLICIVAYVSVPLVFQGVLGTEKMLDPAIKDGSGMGLALASMLGAGPFVTKILVVLLLLSLVLAVMTAMAGSSRTLSQGAIDGYFPRFLEKQNEHGAPTRAMWTDLAFNLVLLSLSDYLFVLAVSNCNYLIFNFLSLNAGWIHRLDNPEARRPWRCPTPLLALGTVLAFFNAFLLGAGANVWGKGTLLAGLLCAGLAIPIYYYRHHIVDKGRFPPGDPALDGGQARAGTLPYWALAGGASACLLGYWIFWI